MSRQMEALSRVAKTSDGASLISYVESLITKVADIRSLTDVSAEQIQGRKVAVNVLETELLAVLKRLRSKDLIEIKEEYE